MSEYLTAPSSFTSARDWLARKVDLPTALGSLDISIKLPARIRAQAFYSARVASAVIVQALRKEVTAIARGDYTYAEGRTRLKEFLARQGYGIPAVGSKEERDIKDIASTRRLDLILRQNVAMAHAVGQREVAEDPRVLEYLPCYEYAAVMDERTRDEHAALNGLILPKTDPFWRTHFPPWEFNCRCMALDTDAEPNGKTSGFKSRSPMNGRLDYNGRMQQLTENESGFEFDSSPAAAFADPDFSNIGDKDIRAKIEKEWIQKFESLNRITQ